MKRLLIVPLMALAMMAIAVRADDITEAEAKRRGVPLLQVEVEKAQKRIKVLEADLAKATRQREEIESAAKKTIEKLTGKALTASEQSDKRQVLIDAMKPFLSEAQLKRATANAAYRLLLKISSEPILTPGEIRVDSMGKFDIGTKLRVIQVINKTTAILEYGRNGVMLYLQGFDTSKQVNDSYVSVTIPVWVSGTKTYNTPSGGTNTVFLVEPLDSLPSSH